MPEELDENVHGCPACGAVVARTRPTCAACWREVPFSLRLNLARAYIRRVRDPVAYQEALAALLQWCLDRIVRREIAVSSWIDLEPLVHGEA